MSENSTPSAVAPEEAVGFDVDPTPDRHEAAAVSSSDIPDEVARDPHIPDSVEHGARHARRHCIGTH